MFRFPIKIGVCLLPAAFLSSAGLPHLLSHIPADTRPGFAQNPPRPSAEKLTEFVHWCRQYLTGDEKGEAQIFLDHLFQALDWAGGLKEAGATLEMRVPKADQGGTAFADLVWKPVVLVEMKKRGTDFQ